ncbi:hypothetical protein AWB74_03333 [Caballeronia arvi]|uniref:Preprotein translocase subunit SecA n=1 Tax=Caballeronia arvi TaxID=1777135 RepID=A0A158J350_9BURK|nr:hypothetical protein AWB74_03333 [Caballeronia arvi]
MTMMETGAAIGRHHTCNEVTMLSPHELAALLLLRDLPEQFGLDQAELDALLEHQLVAVEKRPTGQERFHLTRDGHSVIQAVTRQS